MTSTLRGALLASLLLFSQQAFTETLIIKAVGTWGYFTNYQKHEGPFWNRHIAKVSGQQIIGEIQPQTDLNLHGAQIMRLVKQGVFDFAFGLPGYVTPESAIFEGADLAALVQDIDQQRQVADSYFNTLALAFEQKYNAHLMTLYPFPSQMIWCKQRVASIEDLAGKRIRVFLPTLGDFVTSVGAEPVNLPYKLVPRAMRSGDIDCAITGTMSAYTSELYKVARYGFTLRVGWGLAFGAINRDKWRRMSDEQQALLQSEMQLLTEQMWRETATEDAAALACLGQGPCKLGELGNMTLIEPSAEDLSVRNRLALSQILPSWAARCGPECAANWNRTVGKVLGLKAKAP